MLSSQLERSSWSDALGAILRTLLALAARQGAQEIRIDAGSPRHGSKVFFPAAGEWRGQMILPKHIRASLIERFGGLCGAEKAFSISLPDDAGATFDIRVALPTEAGGDVVLRLELRLPEMRRG